MPVEIVWETRGAFKRHFGLVTGEELLQAIETIESDPRFDSLRYVINDFNDVEGYAVTEEQVLLLAAIDKGASRTNPNILIAVVTEDEQIKAYARQYAAEPLAPYPTRIFSTTADARSWLEESRQAASRLQE